MDSTLLAGLVAYWSLREASGTRSAFNGVSNLSVGGGAPGQAAGPVLFAADFAPNDYLTTADTADLSAGDNDFTLALWAYFDTLAGANRGIIRKGAGATNEWLIEYHDSTDRIGEYDDTRAAWLDCAGLGSPSLSTWYFILFYHDKTADQLGISVNAGSFTTVALVGGLLDTGSALEIGRGYSDLEYFDGRVAEVGFWKRILTQMEIDYLYNNGQGRTYPFGENCSPLMIGRRKLPRRGRATRLQYLNKRG